METVKTNFNATLRCELDNFIALYSSSQNVVDITISNSLEVIKRNLQNSEYRRAYTNAGLMYGKICEYEEIAEGLDEMNNSLLTWLEDLMDYLAVDDLTKLDKVTT